MSTVIVFDFYYTVRYNLNQIFPVQNPSKEAGVKTADQYSEDFKKNGASIEAVRQVIIAMLEEFEEICEARKVTSGRATFSILTELAQKFRAFASRTKLCDGKRINPDAFKLFVQKHIPDVYKDWAEPVRQKV